MSMLKYRELSSTSKQNYNRYSAVVAHASENYLLVEKKRTRRIEEV